jgi:hypothetical protein
MQDLNQNGKLVTLNMIHDQWHLQPQRLILSIHDRCSLSPKSKASQKVEALYSASTAR